MDDDEVLDRLRLAIDTHVLPGSDRYTLEEVAERAGVDPDLTRRIWRALGFPDPVPGDRIGGDREVAVLSVAAEPITISPDPERTAETLVRQTRIIAASIARIAELWVDQIRLALDSGDPALVKDAISIELDQERLGGLLDYLHRRLFASALRRELANRSTGGGTAGTAAFADLVGYTSLTERLDPLELSELIGTFEAIAYDTVATHGGRVVKTIGDEVLFTSDAAARAVDTALHLLDRSAAAGLPDLRVGMDHGPVVWFEGDLFGPTVNRASRLVAEAPVGGLAASRRCRDATPDAGWSDLGELDLKGVGPVEVFTLAGRPTG
jgi:adenylate cyclase